MSLKKLISVLFIAICTISYSQVEDFFIYTPEDAEIIKKNNVSESLIISIDYEGGKISSSDTIIIEYYNSDGRLILVKEFFDFERHISFSYNDKSRINEIEYFWVDENNWRKYNYYYDTKDRLIKYCESNKSSRDEVYRKGDCFEIHWGKKQIDFVSSNYSDTVFYFKTSGEKIIRYTKEKKVDAEYLDGFMVMQKYPDKTYFYERNGKGQRLKISTFQNDNTKVGELVYEYENALPIKCTQYDRNNIIKYQEIFKYVYSEK